MQNDVESLKSRPNTVATPPEINDSDLYSLHVIETARGLTKRIIISHFERDAELTDEEVSSVV